MKVIQILKKLSRDTIADVYYEGEYARDVLRRKKSKNIDILVRNLPITHILKYLKRHFSKIHKSRGAIKISCEGANVSIRLPRRGSKRSPYFSLRDDARTKDFSINAMYLPIRSKGKSNVIDLYNGQYSIKHRRIKTVKRADIAIREAPIIMMKAISLSAELNYKIDNNLFYAIRTNHKLIENQPILEIRRELVKIILSRKPSKYLRIMHKTGLLNMVLPELSIGYGISQNRKYHKYDVFDHCLLSCDYAEPDLTLRLSALLHDIGKPQAREEIVKGGRTRVTFYNHEVVSSKLAKKILKRLRFDKELVFNVGELIYNHMYNYEPNKWSDAAVRRFIKRAHISEENLDNLENLPIFLLRKADRAANGLNLSKISPRQRAFEKRIKRVYNESKALHVSDLAISGDIIMKVFKLKQGPTIGHILKHLLGVVIEDQNMNDTNKLIEETSKYLSGALK